MTPPEFRELVGAFSNLGEDNDFVRAAVEREAEERRELDQKRIQAVAEDARRRAAGWVRALAKEGGVRTPPLSVWHWPNALSRGRKSCARRASVSRAPHSPKTRWPRPSGSRCRARRTGSNR